MERPVQAARWKQELSGVEGPVIAAGDLNEGPGGGAWRTVAVLALGIATVMGPWWARNLVQFGQLDDRSLAVNTLLHGMYPDFLWEDRPETLAMPYKFDPEAPAIGRSTATVLSAIVSLTLSPALCAILLRPHEHGKKRNLFARAGQELEAEIGSAPWRHGVTHVVDIAAVEE